MPEPQGSSGAAAGRVEVIEELRALRAKRRSTGLNQAEQARYSAAVDRFLAAVLEEQNAVARPGQRRRAGVRVSRTVGVKLEWPGGEERSATFDLGLGGFSSVLSAVPPSDAPITATLTVRRGERIVGAARVASSRRRNGSSRVSFAFCYLPETDTMRLKTFIVDDLLPREPRVAGGEAFVDRPGRVA